MAAASAACFAAAAALAVAVAQQQPDLLDGDLAIDTTIHEWVLDKPAVITWAELQSWTGGPAGVTVLSILMVVVLLVLRRPGYATYLAATALGGVVLSETLKDAVARDRPTWTQPLWGAEGYSFPSGHSLAGVTNWVVYGVIVLLLVAGTRGLVLAAVLITWGLLMAPSRLVLGVHWPSDVIEGWLLGFGWVLAVSAVALLLVRRRAAEPAGPV